MQLITERLILREVTLEDSPYLRSYSLEEAYQRFEANPPIEDWEFNYITQWMMEEQSVLPRSYYYLAVAPQENPALPLGSVHLTIQNHTHRQGEIGYMIGTQYHNRGYATEAARALLHFGFHTLRLRRITAADIISENEASLRVAEKLGMRREAHYAETQFFNGRWWDTITCAIHKEDWFACRV
ncbi:MAG: GNAT family N-acetyltransferase [Anaerolineae bacterium]|jgi:RimJ/RimL family protein N-acetyltransferase|nr:GNAT family N-acetyltransferase [Anaerolineae bacterium]